MGVRYRTVRNNFPDIIQGIETLNGRSVEVGCIKGENAWLASIHEYGCNIPVTPKMRAFLHHNGLHLSPNTQVIKIPERSFLRAGHDKYIDTVMKKSERLLPLVIEGQMSADDYLTSVGLLLSTKIKKYTRDLNNPPNHPYTIENKRSSNPLVDTGNLIEGIGFEVK